MSPLLRSFPFPKYYMQTTLSCPVIINCSSFIFHGLLCHCEDCGCMRWRATKVIGISLKVPVPFTC